MPNKIKSGKQFRFLQSAAHGKLSSVGPDKETAKKMLDHEGHDKKKKLARMK